MKKYQKLIFNLLIISFLFIHLAKSQTFPVVYGQQANKVSSKYQYKSMYWPMKDGLRLAVDIYLPKKNTGEKLPTILYQTRYVRSLEIKRVFRIIKKHATTSISLDEITYFVSRGYAVVVVDTRGSGASDGSREMEFSPQEVTDMYTVVDSIISQPWSNGKVGSTGVSYVGTTAMLLSSIRHEAVKVVIPRNAIFDLYADISAPGGIRHGRFVDVWGLTTREFDHNRFAVFGKKAKMAVKGIKPVMGDKKRTTLLQNVAKHNKNFNIADEAIEFRNSKSSWGSTIDDYSAHQRTREISDSKTTMYCISGWFDGGLTNSAIKAFMNFKNPQHLLIGPWDHGGKLNISPRATQPATKFDLFGECLRYFDYYLKGSENKINQDTKVHYYTMGAEQWQSANTWPLPQTQWIRYFCFENQLSTVPPAKSGSTVYLVDTTTGSGNTSRWNSLTLLYKNGQTGYPDQATNDTKRLVFDSAPLNQHTEVTGHPWLDLYLASDTTDACVYAYLEEVTKDGNVIYVTEGLVRASVAVEQTMPMYETPGLNQSFNSETKQLLTPGQPRKIAIEFQPTSYQFQPGSKIRIAIAAADKDHFDNISPTPQKIWIFHGPNYQSQLHLPIIPNNQ